MGTWSDAYRELHAQQEAERYAKMKRFGGTRRTETKVTVTVSESVRGQANTKRTVKTTVLYEDETFEHFEVE